MAATATTAPGVNPFDEPVKPPRAATSAPAPSAQTDTAERTAGFAMELPPLVPPAPAPPDSLVTRVCHYGRLAAAVIVIAILVTVLFISLFKEEYGVTITCGVALPFALILLYLAWEYRNLKTAEQNNDVHRYNNEMAARILVGYCGVLKQMSQQISDLTRENTTFAANNENLRGEVGELRSARTGVIADLGALQRSLQSTLTTASPEIASAVAKLGAHIHALDTQRTTDASTVSSILAEMKSVLTLVTTSDTVKKNLAAIEAAEARLKDAKNELAAVTAAMQMTMQMTTAHFNSVVSTGTREMLSASRTLTDAALSPQRPGGTLPAPLTPVPATTAAAASRT